MYLSAAERGMLAFLVSVARGCIVLVPMVLLLSRIWEMTGVWLSFVITEGLVNVLCVILMFWKKVQLLMRKLYNPQDFFRSLP